MSFASEAHHAYALPLVPLSASWLFSPALPGHTAAIPPASSAPLINAVAAELLVAGPPEPAAPSLLCLNKVRFLTCLAHILAEDEACVEEVREEERQASEPAEMRPLLVL
jgi:hypothetical protein